MPKKTRNRSSLVMDDTPPLIKSLPPYSSSSLNNRDQRQPMQQSSILFPKESKINIAKASYTIIKPLGTGEGANVCLIHDQQRKFRVAKIYLKQSANRESAIKHEEKYLKKQFGDSNVLLSTTDKGQLPVQYY